MAKILQCWELGDGYAYIEGFTAGARVLKGAGHEVGLAYRDLKHAERLVGTDFALFQAPTPVSPARTPLRRPMTFADQLINADYGDAARMLGRVRAWRSLIERLQPEVLRVLHAPGALLAARGLGLPTLVVGTGFLIPPPVTPLPNLRPWIKDANPEAMQAREKRVLEAMNQALKTLGAPELARVADLYRGDGQEIYAFPEMDEYGPRQGVEYMGVYQPRGGVKPAWPEAKGKRVFAYLELFEGLPVALQTLKDSGCAVLVFLPQLPKDLHDKYAGGNLAFADKPLDMALTTAQCDFGVSHGGHNIVSSLLLAGKPQLMLPLYLPERIAAEKVRRMGAGLVSPIEAEKMTAALAQLLAQEVALSAKAREFAPRQGDWSPEDMFKRVAGNIAAVAKKAASKGSVKRAR
jgi:UDP:flavonoid glycosyltransferase YjiC (YdhE family)